MAKVCHKQATDRRSTKIISLDNLKKQKIFYRNNALLNAIEFLVSSKANPMNPIAGKGKISYRWVNLAYRRGKPSYKRPNLASESPNLALGSPNLSLGGVKVCRGHASRGVWVG